MSEKKKARLTEVEVDMDHLPKELATVMGFVLTVIRNGSARDQETLGELMSNAVRASKAKLDYVEKLPVLPERHSKIIHTLRMGAEDLAENGNSSMMLVALVAARRIEQLEDKNEKLTEMLVKADEKK